MSAILWSFAACTDRGLKRENNEDNFYLDGVFLAVNEPEDNVSCAGEPSSSGIIAVFDGLGGESYGELAAFTAASALDKYKKALNSCGDAEKFKALTKAYIYEANREILRRSRELSSRMGTTLALLVFSSGNAFAMNMGDSRIYMLRGGRLEQLSYDHTLAQYLVLRGELSPAAAKNDYRRNSLLKYLGGEEGDHDFIPHYAAPIQAAGGDRFLLCSDGLTDMVSDELIVKILSSAASALSASEELAAAAIKAGGHDNVTALCAFVE